MKIRVLPFAHLRELLGSSEEWLDLGSGDRVSDAWSQLVERCPALGEHINSTRVARNGNLAAFDDALSQGDELALLPPVGGG